MKTESILVTGGAGFIGSHLVDRLVVDRKEVTVIDNLRAGSKRNLRDSLGSITFFEGDIRDKILVKKLVQNADVVFHLAANASVPNSVTDPEYDFETNVIGTFNLLNACVGNNPKFVFASSAAVYGDSIKVAAREDFVANPVSPYGTTKMCGENLCLSFKRTYQVPVVIARIFNVYGPRLPRYVIYDFYMKLMDNPCELEILGDGEQSRQLCYVTDAVDALLLLAQRAEENIYNVAGNQPISIRDLASIMVSKISPTAKLKFTGKSWPGDIKNLIGNISRLRKLGYEPKVGFEEGIELSIKWFAENFGMRQSKYRGAR